MNEYPPASGAASVENGREPAMDDDNPGTIDSQTATTRSAGTRQLEALENQVIRTVHAASAAIGGKVASAKRAAAATGQAVKSKMKSAGQTLSLSRQAQRHPWAIVGGAVAAGYLLHRLLTPRPLADAAPTEPASSPELSPEPVEAVRQPACKPLEPSQPVAFASAESPVPSEETETHGAPQSASLSDLIGPHLRPLQDLAVGVLMSAFRNVVTKPLVAEWREPLSDAIDKITRDFGGIPMGRSAAAPKRPSAAANANPASRNPDN